MDHKYGHNLEQDEYIYTHYMDKMEKMVAKLEMPTMYMFFLNKGVILFPTNEDNHMIAELEQLFREVNEKIRDKKVGLFLKGLPKTKKPKPEEKEFSSDEQLFNIQKGIIEGLADNESCVIVGKCADWILKDRPNVISIYIEAPRRFCVQRVIERMGVSEAIAHKSIEQTDKYRAAYYEYYTGGNYWTNPVNYDLTLNSERVGVDHCVEIIKDYLKIKFPEMVFPT